MDEYWNHNSAYHPRLVSVARRACGSALDVGCGEGLLVQRLAAVCNSVTGIDPDGAALTAARQRVAGLPNVTLIQTGLLTHDCHPGTYDLVTMVATLHHLPLEPALARARRLLRPGGELFVVGLARRHSLGDWVGSGLRIAPVRLLNRWHHEARDIAVRTQQPAESLSEIRSVAKRLLPDARIRSGLYYRYLMRWTSPVGVGWQTRQDES